MFLLGLLELILLVLGGGSQGLLDQFLPDDLKAVPKTSTLHWMPIRLAQCPAGLVVYRPCSLFGLADYLPHPV